MKQWFRNGEPDWTAYETWLASIPPGTHYQLNVLENHYDAKSIGIRAEAIRRAKAHYLVTSDYDNPLSPRATVWNKVRNEDVIAAIQPDVLAAAFYLSDPAVFSEALLLDHIGELKRLGGDTIEISPFTHDGRPVPIATTLRMVELADVPSVYVWTADGNSDHARLTFEALTR